MKEKYFELIIHSSQNNILRELAFEFGVTCIEEIDNGFIIRDENQLNDIKWGLQKFCEKSNIEFKSELEIKDNIDWINQYQKNIKPIIVGQFYIRPSWIQNDDNLINIVIDPALSFGSGHHESTNSCLKLISEYLNLDCEKKTAIDVGSGSGILSIALAKFGYKVDACDTDEFAILSTIKNAKKNNVILNDTWTGSITNTDKTYDIIVANIVADVILVLSKELKNNLKHNGYLILSGILNKYKTKVLEKFGDLKLVENITQNEWESFIFKK